MGDQTGYGQLTSVSHFNDEKYIDKGMHESF